MGKRHKALLNEWQECGHIQYEPYKPYYPLSENNEKN